MAKLCGEIPASWQTYWASKERLRDLGMQLHSSQEGGLTIFHYQDISPGVADAEWAYLLDHHLETASRTGRAISPADIKEIFSLVRFLLKIDPATRPGIEQVLKRPWLALPDEGVPVAPGA